MRIRGGTRGLLTGIDAGRLDEFDAWAPEPPPVRSLPAIRLAKLRRQRAARIKQHRKRLAARPPF